MNLSTIEMTREEAEAALGEWGAAVKAQKCTPEDEAIAAGYAELAKGNKLIALSSTIAAGGEDELHRPRLAVAPALASTIYLRRYESGRVIFSTSDGRTDRWDMDIAVAEGRVMVPAGTLPALSNLGWQERNDLSRCGWRAMVPVVPPRFRTRAWKSCHVLFEAEWAKHTPPAPIDPALIRHLRGDLWIMRGVWDLTPLERAVLTERNRG